MEQHHCYCKRSQRVKYDVGQRKMSFLRMMRESPSEMMGC